VHKVARFAVAQIADCLGWSRPVSRERAIPLSPSPISSSDPWIEFSFLLVVAGLILLNLLVREG
jgi:hypothetical protein